MTRKCPVRFLGEEAVVTPPPYPAAKRALQAEMRRHSQVQRQMSNVLVFAFNAQSGMAAGELTFDDSVERDIALAGRYPIVSARLVCRCRTLDWKQFQGQAGQVQVVLDLADFRGTPLLQGFAFGMDSTMGGVLRAADLTRSLQRVDSLQHFSLQARVIPAAPWLRVLVHLEMDLHQPH